MLAGAMNAYARATSGLELVAVLTSTLPSPTLRTWNLTCELTQPAGELPWGNFSKSWMTGRFEYWRTRACAVSPPALATTLPYWGGPFAGSVSLPLAVSSPLSAGGLITGGGGSPGTASGASIGPSAHSALVSL